MAINRLNQGAPTASAQIPFHDPQNGQDRRASMGALAETVGEMLGTPGAIPGYSLVMTTNGLPDNAMGADSWVAVDEVTGAMYVKAGGVWALRSAGTSPAALVATGSPVLGATAGQVYDGFIMTASGGVPPYTFGDPAGTLPAGLGINPAVGVVNGTPTASGVSGLIALVATDAAQATAILPPFRISVVAAGSALAIAGTPPTTASAGTPYTFAPAITGGAPPYTRTISGQPSGMVHGDTGVSWPSPVEGAYSGVTVGVTDSLGAVASLPAFGLTVASAVEALSISGTPSTSATVGTAYTFTPVASGGTAPRTFSLFAGSLAGTGLAFNASTGAVTGTPSTAGAAAGLTIRVTDALGATADLAAFTITIAASGAATVPAAPTIGTATAGNGTASVAFTPGANGGSAILDFQILASTGQTATVSASPGAITMPNGTPATFTVRARNAIGYGAYSAVSNSVTPSAGVVAPGAPVIGAAVAGDGTVSIFFAPPASDGGSAIIDYTATLSSGQTATAASSPINVTGAPNGSTITVTVRARNSAGLGVASSASSPVTPAATPALLSRYATVGDSNSLRTWDSLSGATLTASGGTATVALPSARALLPGQRVIIYAANGPLRPTFGHFEVLTQPTTTSFTYAYTGSDTASNVACAVAMDSILTDTSHATWLMIYLRQRLQMVFNGAVGGDNAASTRNLRLPAVIAKAPHVVTVMLGTNDITEGRTYAAITADMGAIYDALLAANIKAVLLTTPPRIGDTSGNNLLCSQLAQYTRDYAAAHPSTILVDVHAMGTDVGNPTGPAVAGTMWDSSVHLSADFARRVGKATAAALTSVVAADTRVVPTGIGGGNVVANPQFTDTDSNGTADGVTISYSSASGTPSIGGPVSPQVGNRQLLAVSPGGLGSAGIVELASVHAALEPGKKYRMCVTVAWSGTSPQAIVAGLNMTAGGTAYIIRALTAFTGATYVGAFSEAGASAEGLRMMTEPFTVPAGVTVATPRIQAIARTSGGFTLAVSECFTEEVL